VIAVEGKHVVSASTVAQDNAEFLQVSECIEASSMAHSCKACHFSSRESLGSMLQNAEHGNL
jgi:hypothetical protein